MSKPNTWMPLYIGDYLRKTMRLNAEQHGAYLLLLMAYWQDGPLPDDDDQLAAIARVDARGWARVSKVVRPYFRSEGGQLHHDNAERLKQEALEKYERRSKAGSNNVRTRYQSATNGTATEYQSPPQSQPQSQSSNEDGKHTSELDEAVAEWNRFAAEHDLAQVQRLTSQRKSALKARLREAGGIDGWRAALAKVSALPWMFGSDNGWKVNFDFLLRESKFTKLLEGGYDGGKKTGGWADLARAADDWGLADETGLPRDQQLIS